MKKDPAGGTFRREEFAQKIILLRNEGFSIHGLARRFGVSRNTVRKILRSHAEKRDKGHEVLVKKHKRESKLDSFEEAIKATLKQFPDITGVRLYEKLRESGYTGGISILRELLEKLRPKEQEPVIRFETEPGRQGQMDWSPYTIPFTQTGKATVQCFSYILGFSRRHYIDFTLRHDFYTLIRRHQDAFQHFNGVPLECLYDNEKTVVLRWEAGRPVFNPAFAAFITHYNCKPVACRPRSPQTKGKIEAPFKYVEGNLLNGRVFADLEDLRRTAKWWLAEKSDLHIHDTTKRAPLELFAEEKLQPLPLHPYDTAEVALRVCDAEGMLAFETNRYSVPSDNIADILTIKATETEVMLYNPELELVANHERQPAGSNRRIENPEHAKPKKDRYGLEPVREAFTSLGEAAATFLAGLTERYPRNCGFHARHILRLKEHYETKDIHDALIHALRYQAFDAKSVERILRARAVPRTLESIRNERAGRDLEQTLPKIKQRALAEYEALFNQETDHETADDTGRDGDEHQKTSDDLETDRNAEGS
jgi:transposase